MQEFNDLEAFLVSLEIEKKGLDLYRKAAEKSEFSDIRNLLLELADMEQEHIQIFRSITEEKKGNKDFLKSYDNDDALNYIRSLVQNPVFKSLTVDILLGRAKTVHDLLHFALDAEKNSILFYTEMKNISENPITVEIFGRLLKEEKGHYVMLSERMEDMQG